jgi:tripartite-type tricarboxylate transporter receptor subunit TctC
MSISRRTVLTALGLAPVLLPRAAFAAYPDHPVHMVVPFAAGGNADIVARIVADRMSAALGQPVVVDNRAGAGGSIGAEYVARAEPDGHVLLVGSNGPLTVNPFVQAKLGYDPLKDFAPIALTSYVPHAIIMHPSVEAKTVSELVELSKTKAISIGTSGVGSASHFTLERFNAATGAKLAHIPYRSGGALLPDLIAGNIQAAMTELSTAMPLHRAGQGRIIAVAAAQRSKLAPGVPTMIEGGVKDFTAASYVGILAPRATPPAVIEQLQKAAAGALASGPAPDKLRDLGAEIASAEEMTPAGFGAFIQTEYERSRDAAKLAGLTPQ